MADALALEGWAGLMIEVGERPVEFDGGKVDLLLWWFFRTETTAVFYYGCITHVGLQRRGK